MKLDTHFKNVFLYFLHFLPSSHFACNIALLLMTDVTVIAAAAAVGAAVFVVVVAFGVVFDVFVAVVIA